MPPENLTFDSPIGMHADHVVKTILNKPYKNSTPRLIHGGQHATRAVCYIERLIECIKIIHPDFTLDDKHLKLLQIAALFHDAGREGEETDTWEKQSAEKCCNYLYDVLKRTEEDTKAKEDANFAKGLILYKDEKLPEPLRLEELTLEQKCRFLLHDADCLDIIRARLVFDRRYLHLHRLFKQEQNSRGIDKKAVEDEMDAETLQKIRELWAPFCRLVNVAGEVIYEEGDRYRALDLAVKNKFERATSCYQATKEHIDKVFLEHSTPSVEHPSFLAFGNDVNQAVFIRGIYDTKESQVNLEIRKMLRDGRTLNGKYSAWKHGNPARSVTMVYVKTEGQKTPLNQFPLEIPFAPAGFIFCVPLSDAAESPSLFREIQDLDFGSGHGKKRDYREVATISNQTTARKLFGLQARAMIAHDKSFAGEDNSYHLNEEILDIRASANENSGMQVVGVFYSPVNIRHEKCEEPSTYWLARSRLEGFYLQKQYEKHTGQKLPCYWYSPYRGLSPTKAAELSANEIQEHLRVIIRYHIELYFANWRKCIHANKEVSDVFDILKTILGNWFAPYCNEEWSSAIEALVPTIYTYLKNEIIKLYSSTYYDLVKLSLILNLKYRILAQFEQSRNDVDLQQFEDKVVTDLKQSFTNDDNTRSDVITGLAYLGTVIDSNPKIMQTLTACLTTYIDSLLSSEKEPIDHYKFFELQVLSYTIEKNIPNFPDICRLKNFCSSLQVETTDHKGEILIEHIVNFFRANIFKHDVMLELLNLATNFWRIEQRTYAGHFGEEDISQIFDRLSFAEQCDFLWASSKVELGYLYSILVSHVCDKNKFLPNEEETSEQALRKIIYLHCRHILYVKSRDMTIDKAADSMDIRNLLLSIRERFAACIPQHFMGAMCKHASWLFTYPWNRHLAHIDQKSVKEARNILSKIDSLLSFEAKLSDIRILKLIKYFSKILFVSYSYCGTSSDLFMTTDCARAIWFAANLLAQYYDRQLLASLDQPVVSVVRSHDFYAADLAYKLVDEYHPSNAEVSYNMKIQDAIREIPEKSRLDVVNMLLNDRFISATVKSALLKAVRGIKEGSCNEVLLGYNQASPEQQEYFTKNIRKFGQLACKIGFFSKTTAPYVALEQQQAVRKHLKI